MDDINPENSSYANELPEPPPAEKAAALARMKAIQDWAAGDETKSGDPELEKLDGMLTKVLDIQHPERVKEKIQHWSEQNKTLVYPVVNKRDQNLVSMMQAQRVQKSGNRFYGLNDIHDDDSLPINTIPAEIPHEQVIVNGATVQLRLLADVYISGVLVPKNQLLYGVATLKGERLEVLIHSIGYQGRILPVELVAYDLDGQPGLFIPGAIARDVAKRSADQGIETLHFGTYGATLGAQAASAGIQAAGQLIGKKIKLVKVRVKSGYRVWLKDMNIKKKDL